ncbi:hypothetical protein HanRHA438_Chr00c49g0858521 [Helianthus annuus]|nr:hypothetical protein HanRHA438_Chr00c49g0858521 [Helianthus annuus]
MEPGPFIGVFALGQNIHMTDAAVVASFKTSIPSAQPNQIYSSCVLRCNKNSLNNLQSKSNKVITGKPKQKQRHRILTCPIP